MIADNLAWLIDDLLLSLSPEEKIVTFDFAISVKEREKKSCMCIYQLKLAFFKLHIICQLPLCGKWKHSSQGDMHQHDSLWFGSIILKLTTQYGWLHLASTLHFFLPFGHWLCHCSNCLPSTEWVQYQLFIYSFILWLFLCI